MTQLTRKQQQLFNALFIVVGNAMYALTVVLFLMPSGLITGGATGIALAFNKVTGLPVSGVLFVVNVAMLLLGWWVLGRRFALNTMASTVLSPFFMALWERLLGNLVLTDDLVLNMTAYGRDFLQRMEELSIYVDVSHLSDAGFWDVVRLSRRPVVASHSNSRAVCPHRRNLTDDMFRAIRDSGGVAGLNYYQHFVGDDPTMEGLVRHVEHFLELDGERSLCLGGDMDGCELLAGGMRGLEDVPLLWQALADRGYPQSLLEDLFWNNLRRLI